MFEYIGLIVVIAIFYRIVEEIWKSLQGMPNLRQKYGQDCWAVVTGATDGIGKGFCQILSEQGVNICMIIRNQAKGEELIKELSRSSQSKFKIVIADFQNSDQLDFFDKIHAQIQDLDIGLLFNNVGVVSTTALVNYSEKDLRNMLIVNCFPIVFLTKKILPNMLKRKRSAIVNLSSIAGRVPVPYNQVYSATKAFDDFFSRSLAQEVSNIDVLSLRPLYVSTPMTKFIRGNGAISPYQCAKGAFLRLSLEDASHGHFYHRIQGFIMANLLPNFVKQKMIKIMKRMSDKYKPE